MAHNLKKFSTEADYSAATLNYPAVSWVSGTNSVHFDATAPATFGGLTVHYLIDQSVASVNVNLFNGGGDSESGGGDSESGGGGVLPSAMYVDGVEETVVNSWLFETVGEHIVQYEFEDNTIPESFLDGVHTAKNVTVGTDIIGISALAFNLNLTSASVEATTPPTIADENSFGGGAYGQNYPIYVPTSAVSTYRTQWNSLSSRIEAIQ
jgi:hypothetical protein